MNTWILALFSLPLVVLLWWSPVLLWTLFKGDFEWQQRRKDRG